MEISNLSSKMRLLHQSHSCFWGSNDGRIPYVHFTGISTPFAGAEFRSYPLVFLINSHEEVRYSASIGSQDTNPSARSIVTAQWSLLQVAVSCISSWAEILTFPPVIDVLIFITGESEPQAWSRLLFADIANSRSHSLHASICDMGREANHGRDTRHFLLGL